MKDTQYVSAPRASGTGNQRTKSPWQAAAKGLLQSEMAKYGYDYKQLARALNDDDSASSLITRVNRGTFSVAFFLKAVRVMGTKTIDIAHLPRGTSENDRRG